MNPVKQASTEGLNCDPLLKWVVLIPPFPFSCFENRMASMTKAMIAPDYAPGPL